MTRPPRHTGIALGATAALALSAGLLAAPAVADDESQDWQAESFSLLAEDPSVQAVGTNTAGEPVVVVAPSESTARSSTNEAEELAAEHGAEVVEISGPIEAWADTDIVGGAGTYAPADQGAYVCSVGFSAWSADGDPAAISAGHCTLDGELDMVGLTDPANDDAAGEGAGNPSASYDLGSYGFSQFGGPGNTAGAPDDTVTDFSVIDNINDELDLKPEVTDWTTPNDLSESATPITALGAPTADGADIAKSGRTTGRTSTSAANLDISEGWARVGTDDPDDVRFIKGFGVEDLEGGGGDSGGPVYQGSTAVGLVSGGSAGGDYLWAADLQHALSFTDDYTLQLHIDAPAVESPEDGGTIGGGEDITGTAKPGTTLVVTPDEGDSFEVDVDEDGAWAIPAPDEPGPYAFTLRAEQGYNVSESVSHEVVVTLPAPAFTSPADGDRVTEPITEVSGTGKPDATLTVTGDVEATTTVDEDGDWSVEADLGYGTHTLSATQELDDVTSGEATAEVTVAPAAPEITAPGDGDSFTTDELPTQVEGTGIDDATVVVTVDGEDVGTAEVSDGQWSLALPEDLEAGDHTITAHQSINDVASDEASIDITVTEATAPTTPPGDGDNGDGDDGDDGGGGTLPDTGAPAGLLPALGGAALLILLGAAATRRTQSVV